MVTKPSKEKVIQEAIQSGSLQKWAEIGMSNAEIADKLHISESVFYKWKKQNKEILEALTHARETGPVVEALHGLARLSRGFHEKTVSTHTKVTSFPDGTRKVEHDTYENDVYVAPNPTACAKILANYLNPRKGEGMPTEYISEPLPIQQQEKTGRLTEMDEALKQLFFGEEKKEDAENT